jgi:hypothetical protein
MSETTKIVQQCQVEIVKGRHHTEESFKVVAQEIAALCDAFVEKHGVGIIVGYAAPMMDNPKEAWQGSFILCSPSLANLNLERLTEAVYKVTAVCAANERNKN